MPTIVVPVFIACGWVNAWVGDGAERAHPEANIQCRGFAALSMLVAETGSDVSEQTRQKQAARQLLAYREGALPMILKALSADEPPPKEVRNVHTSGWLVLAAMLTRSGGLGLAQQHLTRVDAASIVRAAVASLERWADVDLQLEET